MKKKPEIKSCPFCGSRTVIRTNTCEPTPPPSFDSSKCETCGQRKRYYQTYYVVICTNIECNPNGLRVTEQEAIKAWNIRK